MEMERLDWIQFERYGFVDYINKVLAESHAKIMLEPDPYLPGAVIAYPVRLNGLTPNPESE